MAHTSVRQKQIARVIAIRGTGNSTLSAASKISGTAKIRVIALLLSLTIMNGSAFAAGSGPEELKGLKSFSIIIEKLPDNAGSCGITEEGLETDLRFILGQSKINLVAQSHDGVFASAECAAQIPATVRRVFGAAVAQSGLAGYETVVVEFSPPPKLRSGGRGFDFLMKYSAGHVQINSPFCKES
jgi:hypothetical protein